MPPSQTPRILIVDDDPVITQLIAVMLQKKNYNVVKKLASGEEAILKSPELSPDLILMDLSLSGALDGVKAAFYIFQLFRYPVLFITGIDDNTLLDQARYAQPYGILFKPFSQQELVTNIDLAMYNHSIRQKFLNTFPAGNPEKITSAQEVIILLDKNGRILFFNPYAAWFMGIPESEILMKHWRTVLMFINTQTQEQLKDPVREVAEQMAVVMYDTNTTAITKDHKNRKVGFTILPLKDDQDRFLAALMKIKEKIPGPGTAGQ